MDPTASSQHREQRFRALYDASYVDLLRFVRRRVHPTHAEDVVGEVMLVAWRRLDDVPADLSGARAWLFSVAHKTLLNSRRREGRQEAVAVRLAEVAPASATTGRSADAIAHRLDIAAAWPRLSAVHQEAIVLAVLDGLTAPEAALVLHTASARTDAALRDLDLARTTTLTDEERQHADAMLARILAAPGDDLVRTETNSARRRRARVLVPVGVLAAAAVSVPMTLGGGSAFASWTANPEPLSPSAAEAAATTCRSALDIRDRSVRVVIGERRGGWTYVLLDGSGGEAACLMPDDLVGSHDGAVRRSGFFGSYDTDPVEAPTPARDGIIETESAGGAVTLPDRLGVGTMEGWFSWVTGYAGSDVTGVTVHPPVGPDVEASLNGGRFSAWWPAGEARGANPGVGGAWTYSVTLADGTTRRVEAPQ